MATTSRTKDIRMLRVHLLSGTAPLEEIRKLSPKELIELLDNRNKNGEVRVSSLLWDAIREQKERLALELIRQIRAKLGIEEQKLILFHKGSEPMAFSDFASREGTKLIEEAVKDWSKIGAGIPNDATLDLKR